MNKKSYKYIIEYTRDSEHTYWETWDDKTYISYQVCKDEIWKLSQAEAEYNRTEESENSYVRKIQGFRIVQVYTEITHETVMEFLF
jgi:hypothetical protein